MIKGKAPGSNNPEASPLGMPPESSVCLEPAMKLGP